MKNGRLSSALCKSCYALALVSRRDKITGLFCNRALESVLQMKNGCLPCMSFYGVALLSRIDNITGLFCKRAL